MSGPLIVATLDVRSVALVKGILDPTRAKRGAMRGIRIAMALIERHHKEQEMVRGVEKAEARYSSAIADPNRLSWRTGQLARSYRIAIDQANMIGYYGSDLRRARLLETGGVITPKTGRCLAIPTAYARVGRGAALWPKDYPKGALFRIGMTLFKARLLKTRSDLIPMFNLVPRVRIKARPTVARTATATSLRAAQAIADSMMRELAEVQRGA